MSDINMVVLTGHVGQDAEQKKAGDSDLATFSLAVSEWAGEGKPERTTWVTCQLWGKRANVAQYIRKGDRLTVRGRLSIRKVETEEGNKYYTSVNVDDLILPPKGSQPTAAKARKQAESGGAPF
jgi:single-strand DNA-binding protein